MKIKLITFSVLLLAFASTSCKENKFEEYEGSWSGTYSGEDHGTWNVNIDEDGKIDGTARTDSFPNYPFEVTGSVSESGEMEASTDVFWGTVLFNGQISGSNASGTWSNNEAGISGTWKGSKK